MITKNKIAFTVCISLTSFVLRAQTGSWNILSIKMPLNGKWSFFTEAQIRSLRLYDNFHYYEYKAGISCNLDKNFSLAAGIGDFDTYSAGGNFKQPQVNDETRTWIQITMKNYLKRLKFEHRYRAEQRYTSNGYRNRFRYRLAATVPVNRLKMAPKTFYANISNEIFFTNNAPYFERNRFFIGGGYEYSDNFTLQAGYLHQFDYRLNDETGRGFFQISFLIDLKWKNQSSEKIPGGME
jgi:Protein of unknown function (DUF2490)